MGPALAWPEVLELSRHQLMLDIGGGSGTHCIGATLRWPQLDALLFDMAPVCEVAQELITRQGLESRIRTHVGDLWNDPFPSADLHFYSMVYHDWPPEKCLGDPELPRSGLVQHTLSSTKVRRPKLLLACHCGNLSGVEFRPLFGKLSRYDASQDLSSRH